MAILPAMNTRLAQMIPALLVVIAVACATQPTSNLTPMSSPPPLLPAATPQNADLGALELSIAKYDEAIRLNPQLASAFANRAVAYTYLGRDLEAQQDTKRGIELWLDRGILQSAIQKAQRNR